MPTVYKLPGNAIEANTITTTQLMTTVVTQIQAGASGGPKVKSLIYPGNDTAANTVGGQTLYLTGSGFAANAQVLVNGNAVPSQSFISASNISFTTPAISTGTYPVYVINPEDGATAILYPGLLISGEPAWVNPAGSLSSSQSETESWSYSLSATGDTPITYSLAAGSSLPGGISLAANGLISGTLSSPTGNTTTYTFSVVANDAQNQESTRQFTVTVSPSDGVLFANNVLLIHANGTNNKNNHHFLDSSNNNFTITRYGNTTQGSFSPFSQTGWSNYFDGTGDYLSISDNAAFDLGSGDFTLECWAHTSSFNSQYNVLACQWNVSNGWIFRITASLIGLYANIGGTQNYTASVTNITGTWDHFAITRTSNTLTFWKNGTSVGTAAISGTINNSSESLVIGVLGDGNSTTTHAGYISNLRIVKGTALYASNFTPSTTALTAVSNTSLLTCQSNRFKDNSNNNFTITRNGDVSVQPFSPFAPTAEYSTANVGGSGYFDGGVGGTTDYLTVPAGSAFAPGTGDFTIEAWVYPTTNSVDQYIWTQTVSGTNYFMFTLGTTGGFTMTGSGGGTPCLGPANAVIPFAWNHVAAVRQSGVVRVYVNGVSGSTQSNAMDLTNTSLTPTIGTYTHSIGSSPLYGYVSDLRYVKGTAVYTSNFTPPTAPLTNIANTSFLCNFTNAGIFDQTAKNVLETVGDTKISTAQYKYGTASMYFDGTGDYLETQTNPQYLFGTGDFTIESWVRWDASKASAYNIMFDWRPTSTNGVYPMLYVGASGNVKLYTSSTDRITSNAITANTWTHVALVRYSGNTKLYIDGTQSGSTYTDSNSYLQNRVRIGESGYSLSDGLGYKGYLDDIRITKGYARYTGNFTAPSSAFRDK